MLIFGGKGILGSEILRLLESKGIPFTAPNSQEVDIRNAGLVNKIISELEPKWIINCAAWTNVERAEEDYDAAFEINGNAVGIIGKAARTTGSRVIHLSSDYVFDGNSSKPYKEKSTVNPLNRYGESKLRGEILLQSELHNSYVVRTSWLFGLSGKNFVKSILDKALKGENVRVVSDQIGSPTSARELSAGIFSLMVKEPEPGIYHYSSEGECSWFEIAKFIYFKAGADQSLVKPIKTESLSLRAKRPRYSYLSKEKWHLSGFSQIPHWTISIENMLPEMISDFQK